MASAWLVNTGDSQQSGGGISSLGIIDDGKARSVGHPESPAAALQVIAESWNPIVQPPEALVLEGSDDRRTSTIDPTNGRSGISIVTLAVTDGSTSTSMSFEVTVENGDVVTHVLAPLE